MRLHFVPALALALASPAAAQFSTTCNGATHPLAPCNDATTSLGMLQIQVNSTFASLFGNTAGYNAATGVLTSPVLYDSATSIGRSAAFKDGSISDIAGVQVGTIAVNSAAESNLIFPSSLAKPPAGTDELLNELYSLTLKNPAGTFIVSAGAFNGARSLGLHSYGTVQSNSGASNNAAMDFPATWVLDSFVTVEINIGIRTVKLANWSPLIFANNRPPAGGAAITISTLPPRVILMNDATTWTPLFFTDSYPGVWNLGDCAGFIIQAGLGTGYAATGTDAGGNWMGPDVASFSTFLSQQPVSTNNTITVTRLDDPLIMHTGVSLRDAILSANAGTGGQTIVFPRTLYPNFEPQTLGLFNGALPTITAPDVNLVNLLVGPPDNPLLTVGDGAGYAVFQIAPALPTSPPNRVGIFGISIADESAGPGSAGGIGASNADVFLGNVTVRDNSNDNSGGGPGGGISLTGGQLFLSNSSVNDNEIDNDNPSGGGIAVMQGVLTIVDSVINDNSASGSGGGIYATESRMMLTRVSVSDNDAETNGGGVAVDQGSAFFMTSSTISDNSTIALQGQGGGYYAGTNTSGVLAGNSINYNSVRTGSGAIFLSSPNLVTVTGNLMAANTSPATNFTAINNLISDTDTGMNLMELDDVNGKLQFWIPSSASTVLNACNPVTGFTPILDHLSNLIPTNPATTISCGSVQSVLLPGALGNPVGVGQNAAVNTTLPFPLQTTLTDVNGNVLPYQPVTFAAPATGPSGTFAAQPPTEPMAGRLPEEAVIGSAVQVTGDIHGVATATPLTNNSIAGPYTVQASVGGLNTPESFPVTNGIASVSITLQTSPPGLLVSFDGSQPAPAPLTMPLVVGSIHSISTQATQAGATGTQYVWQSWSAGGPAAVSGTITVPAIATTYTASFNTQYQLTISASPAAGGTVTPASGAFYASGATVNISATANSGYQFGGWTGPVTNASSASTTVTMSGPETVAANFAQLVNITVNTAPTGLQFTIDGGQPQTAPQQFSYAAGTQHTISLTATQNGSAGTQYVFSQWADGNTTNPRSITVTSAASYTANFNTQFQLSIAASPAAGGTVIPTGGFYNSGAVVNISATANSGYTFSNWSGNVASASIASTTVTMSTAETVTANFSSLTGITIQTNPTGLQFTVDGGAQAMTAPQTLSLTPGSHTINLAATQAGGAGTQYVFSQWADGNTTIPRTITVTSSPATYTANFNTQYQLTISPSPAAGGTVTPASGVFYNSGTSVPISANANSGFQFSGWSGPVTSSTSASTSVTMSAPETVTANFSSITGITIQTNPTGLQFSIDGGAAQTAPQTLGLSPGTHTIAVASTQAGAAGTQYVFLSWSDAGAASHAITVGSSAAVYTATFTTQYQLTISGSPANGGTVTPASGTFYSSGASVNINATANSGFQFSGWTGPVTSPSSASTTVTMNAPATVTANFNSLSGITIQTTPPGLQFTVDGGAAQTAPQTLALSQSTHTIAVAATQAGATGTQYTFIAWSDSGLPSHTITVGPSAATYVATFQTQYQLTISGSPANGGTVTPASGAFYNSGASVNISATANAGYQFVSWTGAVASAPSASTTVTMSAPETVVAAFAIPGFALNPASANVIAASGNGTVQVIATIQTAPWTAMSDSSFLTITSGASGTGNGTVGYSVAANTTSSARTGTLTIAGQTFTVTQAAAATAGMGFFPVVPCRVVDTRAGQGFTGQFGPPSMAANQTRSFTIPSSGCNIPATAQAYSLNVTVVPAGGLGYLTIWPAGQAQPYVSTLNSSNGAVLANAAIVPAGASGAVSVFVTDATDLIVDIDGYFAAPNASALAFYAVTPCRVADTRSAGGAFSGVRSFAVLASGCGIPATAQAYSMNVTGVPPGPLAYLTTWPTGQTQPNASTLNAYQGQIAANAAIVPAGTNGALSVFASNSSNVVLDINGYFAPPGTGALYFYPLAPCRIADTRTATGTFGGPSIGAGGTRTFPIPSSSCGVPTTAQAYSLNMTVVPPSPMFYLSAWPAGLAQPVVSTLNDLQGQVIANAAIVPAGASGGISVFVSDATNLVIDINGYFGQ